MKWQIVQLQKIASEEKGSIVSGPFGSNISAKYFVDEGIPVIRGNNLTKGERKFIDDGFVYLTETKAAEFRNCIAIKDDIVFTAVGSIGQVGIIPDNTKFEKYVISNKQLRVRIDKKKADPMFVYYWLTCPRMTSYLEGMNNGGAVPLLNLGIIRRIPIPLPSLDTQFNISNIISNFNNSIDINHQQVQLLEEAGRLLFREWFVYFRFPGHKRAKFIDGAPLGWEKTTLGNIANQIKKNYTIDDEDLSLIDLARISSRTLAVTNVGLASDLETARIIFDKDDVLFSSIRPYLHKVVLAPFKGITNTSVFVIRAKTPIYRAYITFLLFSDYVIQFANQHSTGTKMPVVKWNSLSKLPVIIPPQIIIEEFQNIVWPMLGQIQLIYFKNQKLEQARNLLLPLLMDGTIKV
ncbi:MAG: restriction endonuclease subunit S [Candidatus Humimicrobiaceae bacterium]